MALRTIKYTQTLTLSIASSVLPQSINGKFLGKLSEGYNRNIRPFSDVKPLNVYISLHVKSFRSISDQTMTYQFECYFREEWYDERLAFEPIKFENKSFLQLPETMGSMLWMPDTFMPNAIESTNPEVDSITHRSMLRLKYDGRVVSSRRYSITAECPMDLRLYPFDIQICPLSIESYGYTANEVIYNWKSDEPIAVSDGMQIPTFKLLKVVTKNQTVDAVVGSFKRLNCCFVFKRSAGMFYLQVFLPAIAIVLMSWLVLWTKTENQFSDMIAVILAITLQYFTANTVMPNVSYIKALDIFMVVCFLFVFAALLKQATAHLIEKAVSNMTVSTTQNRGSQIRPLSQKCRCLSNVLFMGVFFGFCVVYFGVLLLLDAEKLHALSECEMYD